MKPRDSRDLESELIDAARAFVRATQERERSTGWLVRIIDAIGDDVQPLPVVVDGYLVFRTRSGGYRAVEVRMAGPSIRRPGSA